MTDKERIEKGLQHIKALIDEKRKEIHTLVCQLQGLHDAIRIIEDELNAPDEPEDF